MWSERTHTGRACKRIAHISVEKVNWSTHIYRACKYGGSHANCLDVAPEQKFFQKFYILSWMYSWCIFGSPQMYLSCISGVPRIFFLCTSDVPPMYPRCSSDVSLMYLLCRGEDKLRSSNCIPPRSRWGWRGGHLRWLHVEILFGTSQQMCCARQHVVMSWLGLESDRYQVRERHFVFMSLSCECACCDRITLHFMIESVHVLWWNHDTSQHAATLVMIGAVLSSQVWWLLSSQAWW